MRRSAVRPGAELVNESVGDPCCAGVELEGGTPNDETDHHQSPHGIASDSRVGGIHSNDCQDHGVDPNGSPHHQAEPTVMRVRGHDATTLPRSMPIWRRTRTRRARLG